MSDSAQEVVADLATDKALDNPVQDKEVGDQREMVSRDELNKVLDEMHNYKRQAKEFEESLSKRKMDELKQKDEWQKVAQIKEEEATASKAEADKLRDSIIWDKKYSALKEQALRSGIRREALSDLELIDFQNDLAIETTNTGKVNVLGADRAINSLKSTRPHWFGSKGGNVNSSSPEVVVGGGPVTMQDIFKAEKKAKESGDYAPYYKIMKQYKQNQ